MVTPLNLLGRQNVDCLEDLGIPAVAVDGDSLNEKVLKVSLCSMLFREVLTHLGYRDWCL